MHDCRNAGAPFGTHVAGDRHVSAGTPIDVCYVEDLRYLLALDDRREGHELGTLQPGVQQIVGFASRRICKNCTCTERARSEFLAMRIDRTDLAGLQLSRRSFDRRLVE